MAANRIEPAAFVWIGTNQSDGGGVEDTKLEAKNIKKSEAKDNPSEDRPPRGQGPRIQRESDLKKKIFNFVNFPKDSGVLQKKKTKVFASKFRKFYAKILAKQNWLLSWPIFNKSTNSADRAFSRTCRLRGQGLQIFSSRTSSRPRTSSSPRLHFRKATLRYWPCSVIMSNVCRAEFGKQIIQSRYS